MPDVPIFRNVLVFFSLRPAAVCQQRAVKASRSQPNPLPSSTQHAKAFHPFHRYQIPARNHSYPSDTHTSVPQRQHLRGNQTKTQGMQFASKCVVLRVCVCVRVYMYTCSCLNCSQVLTLNSGPCCLPLYRTSSCHLSLQPQSKRTP